MPSSVMSLKFAEEVCLFSGSFLRSRRDQMFIEPESEKIVEKLQRSEIFGIEVHCAPSELKNTLA